jgi:hypothetical protein
MTSEVGNEFEAKYDDRVRNIRHAAAAALKELSLFRSGGTRDDRSSRRGGRAHREREAAAARMRSRYLANG